MRDGFSIIKKSQSTGLDVFEPRHGGPSVHLGFLLLHWLLGQRSQHRGPLLPLRLQPAPDRRHPLVVEIAIESPQLLGDLFMQIQEVMQGRLLHQPTRHHICRCTLRCVLVSQGLEHLLLVVIVQ